MKTSLAGGWSGEKSTLEVTKAERTLKTPNDNHSPKQPAIGSCSDFNGRESRVPVLSLYQFTVKFSSMLNVKCDGLFEEHKVLFKERHLCLMGFIINCLMHLCYGEMPSF